MSSVIAASFLTLLKPIVGIVTGSLGILFGALLLQLTSHCAMESALPITAAHTLTERGESELRNLMSHLGRVVIRVDPPNGEGVTTA